CKLLVPPVEKFLTVSVTTDKPEYGPGDECSATVSVRDASGRSVPGCELSLGVVDEALYSVERDSTPDLRAFLHHFERKTTIARSFFFEEKFVPFQVWKVPTFVRGLPGVYLACGGGAG